MALRITFDLEEADLKFFQKQMNRAKKSAKEATEEQIIAGASEALSIVRKTKVPKFVTERLDRIQSLIKMLGDAEWNLEGEERKNVITALTYFADPDDLIPDDVPVIGFIDDAIMIELVVRELTHEIEAYDDFCLYRKSAPKAKATRDEWLQSKRRALYARMRRRRTRTGRSGGTRFRIF
ncbi:MAG TPA: YkvA family protein [Pseudomonadales bacterium]|nr:YkvA family protein [Pseudomonadales bacterium]